MFRKLRSSTTKLSTTERLVKLSQADAKSSWLETQKERQTLIRSTCQKYKKEIPHNLGHWGVAKFAYARSHNLLYCVNNKVSNSLGIWLFLSDYSFHPILSRFRWFILYTQSNTSISGMSIFRPHLHFSLIPIFC